MTGYEPFARIQWQKAMKELKDNIDNIWLVSDSPLIIAGARIMSMFTSFHIDAVKNEQQICKTSKQHTVSDRLVSANANY